MPCPRLGAASRMCPRSVRTSSAESNAPARALYAALGYRQIGLRKRYYRRGDGSREDAILLGRDLT